MILTYLPETSTPILLPILVYPLIQLYEGKMNWKDILHRWGELIILVVGLALCFQHGGKFLANVSTVLLRLFGTLPIPGVMRTCAQFIGLDIVLPPGLSLSFSGLSLSCLSVCLSVGLCTHETVDGLSPSLSLGLSICLWLSACLPLMLPNMTVIPVDLTNYIFTFTSGVPRDFELVQRLFLLKYEPFAARYVSS
jgi:hypothetical protein